MFSKLCMAWVVLGGLVLLGPMAKGQDPSTGPQKPISPVGAEESTSRARQSDEGTLPAQEPKIIPDARPLAGAQNLALGAIAFNHVFLQPSFNVTTQAERFPDNSVLANGNNFQYLSYLTGRLGLNRTSGRSELLLDYTAGGTFSNNPIQGNAAIQNLDFSDTIHWGRWSQLFGDQFSYLSESPFGFGGLGGLNNLGIGLGNGAGGALGPSPSFRADLLPNQTILTVRSPRISNAVIAQTDYELSRRSSLTFVGSYGILKFMDGGLQDGRNVLFQAGFNHTLNRKDAVSVQYRFSEFMFPNQSERIDDHSMQLTYAKRIAGRLSWQAGAGPEVNVFRTPLAGSSTRVNWTFSSTLSYQRNVTSVGFNFNRFLSGGSGILQGAQTSQFEGFLNRSLGRNWDTGLSLGYSRNQSLQQTTPAANTISVDTWFATARVGRRFGRSGNLFFAYTAQKQSNISSVCLLSACGLNTMTHIVSVGYNWGLRPIVIE